MLLRLAVVAYIYVRVAHGAHRIPVHGTGVRSRPADRGPYPVPVGTVRAHLIPVRGRRGGRLTASARSTEYIGAGRDYATHMYGKLRHVQFTGSASVTLAVCRVL